MMACQPWMSTASMCMKRWRQQAARWRRRLRQVGALRCPCSRLASMSMFVPPSLAPDTSHAFAEGCTPPVMDAPSEQQMEFIRCFTDHMFHTQYGRAFFTLRQERGRVESAVAVGTRDVSLRAQQSKSLQTWDTAFRDFIDATDYSSWSPPAPQRLSTVPSTRTRTSINPKNNLGHCRGRPTPPSHTAPPPTAHQHTARPDHRVVPTPKTNLDHYRGRPTPQYTIEQHHPDVNI